MDPQLARRYLAYLRLGIGGMWLAPRLGGRIFGLDPEAPGFTLLARLFAARDAAMAASLLKARGADADRQVDMGIAVDAADLVAILAAASRKQIGARTTLLGGLAAGGAVVLGLLGRDDR